MNGKELEGKTLFVSLAQPKSTRQKHMKRNFGPAGNGAGNGGQRGMPRNMMMNQMPMNQMYQMYQMYRKVKNAQQQKSNTVSRFTELSTQQ